MDGGKCKCEKKTCLQAECILHGVNVCCSRGTFGTIRLKFNFARTSSWDGSLFFASLYKYYFHRSDFGQFSPIECALPTGHHFRCAKVDKFNESPIHNGYKALAINARHSIETTKKSSYQSTMQIFFKKQSSYGRFQSDKKFL